MKFELAKGVQDYTPEAQILRQEVIGRIRTVFERYGFSPIETPVIERLDTLTAKFGAGEGTDVMDEIFRLKDQGNRDLGLKFDMTVPLARFMAQNPTLKLPFKRYAIDRAFRDGPIKLGRDREFYQCDADIVGVSKMTAEAELIALTIDVFKALDLEITFEFNSRKLMSAIMDSCKVPEDKKAAVAIIIDKIKKIRREEMLEELQKLGIEEAERLIAAIEAEGSPDDVLAGLKAKLASSEKGLLAIQEVYALLSYLTDEQKEKVTLNLGLARGLNYYTGTVMEAFLKDSRITSSVAGGGRYDDMIGQYVGRGSYPAIGISFGLVPIIEAIKLAGYEQKKTVTDVLIVPIAEVQEAMKLAQELRDRGINTAVDLNGKGVSKNLAYANYYSIPYCILLGEEEVRQGVVKLRDMESGEEKTLKASDIEI
jgi:histidyl-tRNA synthetase